MDPSESGGSDRKAANQIGEDHGLAKELSKHPQSPRRDNAEGDVVDDLVHDCAGTARLKRECLFKTIVFGRERVASIKKRARKKF